MSRIAILMSGGLDSSGAAAILTQAGHDVAGITARMSVPSSKCCGEDDIYRAERVCHKLGIPHIVLDLREDFDRRVVRPFVSSYLEGLTPNPCADCNREIKFGKILGLAVRSGFDRVASGHYAAIKRIDDRPHLCEPADERKSQVYFLALVKPDALEKLEFPLARIPKREVRQITADLNLTVRDGESQDLCFVPSGAYHRLLTDRWDGPTQGDVLDLEGNTVARHKGHYAYTVGQRFGLRGKRYYVIEKRARTNEIVIAERQQACKRKITIINVNFFLPFEDFADKHLSIKYRYNSPRIAARVLEGSHNRLTFLAAEPCFAPAPGQLLACYRDDCLVCGGTIESAS